MIAVVKIAYRLGESSKILSATFMFLVTSNAKQLVLKSTVINLLSRKYESRESNKAANEMITVIKSIFSHPFKVIISKVFIVSKGDSHDKKYNFEY